MATIQDLPMDQDRKTPRILIQRTKQSSYSLQFKNWDNNSPDQLLIHDSLRISFDLARIRLYYWMLPSSQDRGTTREELP